MLWPLVETWTALPRMSEAYLTERQWFDLKFTYKPGSQAEMAKDLAAFANAQGGALIIGAKEGPTEPDYTSPLRAEVAERIALEFDLAVRDHCRPSPTIHVRTIPSRDAPGMVVLVINIEPAVDQPIAARVGEKSFAAWRFPVRVGRDTEFLFPEQLPLYMNSKARRAKLLLLRALAAGGDVDLFDVPPGSWSHGNIRRSSPFKLDAVDTEGGGSVLLRDGTGNLGSQSIAVPLDDVEAVWLQHDGRWAMRISGHLDQFSDDGHLDQMTSDDEPQKCTLFYIPPMTTVVSPLGSVIEDLSKQVREVVVSLRSTLSVQHLARCEPSDDEIREQAHNFWDMRQKHNRPGSPLSDWLNARRAVLAAGRDR